MAGATGSRMDITDVARRVAALAATEERLFQVVGGWVVSTDDPAVKLCFARSSRHHGDHVVALSAVLPDTRDHDPEALVAAGGGVATAELDAAASSDERLTALALVLSRQLAALDEVLAAGSPIRDGPVLRVARAVRDADAAEAEALAAPRPGG